MWEQVGLVRTREGLAGALVGTDCARARGDARASRREPAIVARLVATAALARPESRGAHFRSDHPATDAAWRRRIVLTPAGDVVRLSTAPVARAARRGRGGVRVSEMPPLPHPLRGRGASRAARRTSAAPATSRPTRSCRPDLAAARAALVARAPAASPDSTPALLAFRCSTRRCRVDVRARDGEDVAPGETIALVESRAGARAADGRAHGAQPARPPQRRRDRHARTSSRGSRACTTRVVCTRKTTPGLRALEKHAVRLGGGGTHRYGLDDAVLVKDNHVALAGGVTEAVARVRRASATW